MASERFVLIDDYDGGCAIRDSSKPGGYDILASLPVHAWAMAPLVDELNKLQAIADAAREIVADADRPQLARNWATDRLQSALAAYDAT